MANKTNKRDYMHNINWASDPNKMRAIRQIWSDIQISHHHIKFVRVFFSVVVVVVFFFLFLKFNTHTDACIGVYAQQYSYIKIHIHMMLSMSWFINKSMSFRYKLVDFNSISWRAIRSQFDYTLTHQTAPIANPNI